MELFMTTNYPQIIMGCFSYFVLLNAPHQLWSQITLIRLHNVLHLYYLFAYRYYHHLNAISAMLDIISIQVFPANLVLIYSQIAFNVAMLIAINAQQITLDWFKVIMPAVCIVVWPLRTARYVVKAYAWLVFKDYILCKYVLYLGVAIRSAPPALYSAWLAQILIHVFLVKMDLSLKVGALIFNYV